jgi:hypothetical protein
MTKAEALEWLKQHGSTVRGYPQEIAAAYVGLGVKRFRDEVAKGRLPKPNQHGKRLLWDKVALDRHLDNVGGLGSNGPEGDPIMASIHAAQTATVRPTGPG